MNTQINVRMPSKLLASAKVYAEEHGFGTVQEFMKEAVREKLFEDISKEELDLIKKLINVAEKENLYGTEEEIFK